MLRDFARRVRTPEGRRRLKQLRQEQELGLEVGEIGFGERDDFEVGVPEFGDRPVGQVELGVPDAQRAQMPQSFPPSGPPRPEPMPQTFEPSQPQQAQLPPTFEPSGPARDRNRRLFEAAQERRAQLQGQTSTPQILGAQETQAPVTEESGLVHIRELMSQAQSARTPEERDALMGELQVAMRERQETERQNRIRKAQNRREQRSATNPFADFRNAATDLDRKVQGSGFTQALRGI